MRKGTKAWLRNLLYYPIMAFCCLEIALRILGYESFQNEDYSVKSSPENAFVGDATLGIRLNAGEYRTTVNGGLTFGATHLATNSRLVVGNAKPDSSDVVFLGCSFTYGFGVNDGENFTSLLQNKFPKWNFQNAGVIGYGSVQSLLQLRELVEKQPLEAVVLNFSSFHFMRNTLSPQYRANLKIGYGRSSTNVENQMNEAKFPFKMACGNEIQQVSWSEIYENWWGREWLASVNWWQTSYDYFQEDLPKQIEITACILNEMNTICQENNIRFGIACLDSTPETDLLKSKLAELNWLDVGFDFTNEKLTNHPFDSHPNGLGHRQIAGKIEPFLIELIR
jgi:hypothetical protein